jgi:hypothetical protein
MVTVELEALPPMAFANPVIGTKQEEEWQELQAVLQSGILDKAPNLKHFLEYVAQQYFSGSTEQVKEYSIAIQALHRQAQFDPQSDTIVRVTAHTLRKKLEQYYATEGADHPIQIRLPAGKYVLQFEHREQVSLPAADLVEVSPPPEPSIQAPPSSSSPLRITGVYLAILGAAGLLLLGVYFLHYQWAGLSARPDNPAPTAKSGAGSALTEAAGTALDRAIRIRLGAASHPYVDVAGQTWLSDQYCKGGSAFSHPNQEIQGTDDPALFQEGREGKFQCRILVPPGTYQLLLLFADTSGDKEAARQVDLSINNVVTSALDIVDEAGGDDIVVGKVYAGIHPMSDGAIHLDFTSDGSFVNAIELTPSESDAGFPLRMLAGPAVFHDSEGNTWLPERFFQGGRRTFHPDNLPKIANSRLFEWERYGHFHYRIPTVAGKEYKVRLYFSEGWFGVGNGGPGGAGSRVFDIYCDGTTLLRNFDILQSQENGVAVVTFDHVKPTAHGVLELDFTPVKNYPLINAIEVEPES